MSKAPDLSAFPIPRKGSARPIEIEEAPQSPAPPLPPDEPEASTASPPVLSVVPQRGAEAVAPKKLAARLPTAQEVPQPVSTGQMVATTVKLDEDRYLRLSDAGRPGPGRLKRRTIQEMMIEALDEWFEKRGI